MTGKLSKEEAAARQRGQETVDRIVKQMCDYGYPVEMTHKSGFRKDHIPTDWIGNWSDDFEGNLAQCLINGYDRKSSLILLMQVARSDAFERRLAELTEG